MKKTLKRIMAVTLLAGTASHAEMLTYVHATEKNWSTVANWRIDTGTGDPAGRVPLETDTVQILSSWAQAGVSVTSPGAVAGGQMLLGRWGSGASLTVESGGTLTVGGVATRSPDAATPVELVNHGTFTSTGVMYMNNGTTTISNSGTFACGGLNPGDANMISLTVHNTGTMNITDSWLYLSTATGTNCTWNMLGGEINVTNHIAMPTGGSAHLNLHGGTITTPSIQLQTDGNYTIDVRGDGELVISGSNQTNELNSMISLGLITASAGGTLMTEFDGADSTLYVRAPQPLTLPNVFADNMVLQRQAPIPVYGITDIDSSITVSLFDAADAVVASTNHTIAGRDWKAWLPALEAGGPYTLEVAGDVSGTNAYSNVMIGEVYVLAGQSNMDWGIGQLTNKTDVLAEVASFNLRIISPSKTRSATPRENYLLPDRDGDEVTWKELDADSGLRMSALGYFFGREMTTELGVTVGIVNASRGGTYIHQWVPLDAIEASPLIDQATSPSIAHALGVDPEANAIEQWYNALVVPVQGYGARAILWYQGEGNVWWQEEYQDFLSLLMQTWRDRWEIGSIPFLVFQLPGLDKNYDPNALPAVGQWGRFREAQEWIVDNNDDAYLVVNVPGGERNEIHPQDKEGVGWRASRVALKNLHGQNIVGSGPTLLSAQRAGNSIFCTFDTGGAPLVAPEVAVDGLLIPGDSLSGFAVAGSDGIWADATAYLYGSSNVVVSSPAVVEPVEVMYGMESFPLCNLYNTADMPCAPFRAEATNTLSGTALYYQSATESSWFSTSNWLDDTPGSGVPAGRYPSPADEARILSGWAQAGVSVDAPGAVSGGQIKLGLWGSGARLTVESAGTLSVGSVSMNSPNEANPSELINHGEFTASGVMYANGGKTSISNTGTFACGGLNPGHANMTSFTVHNSGDMDITAGWLYLATSTGTNCTFNMLGGTLDIANKIAMAEGGSARLNLHGGTITTAEMGLLADGNYLIDVTGDGKLIVERDQWGDLNYFLDQGYLISSDGGTLLVELDESSNTVVSVSYVIPRELSPANGALLVDPSSTVSATFPTDLSVGSGFIVLTNLTDGTARSISVSDGSQVTISGSVLTLHPDPPLDPYKQYAILIPSGVLTTDPGGEPLEIVSPDQWAFWTGAAEPRTYGPIVAANGRFTLKATGERFHPVGFNYIDVRENPNGGSFHLHDLFNPSRYDPVRVASDLSDIAAGGFNTVRVFIDGNLDVGVFRSAFDSGPSPEYMANIVDFLDAAHANELYVILTLPFSPAVRRYQTLQEPVANIEGINRYYLSPGHIAGGQLFLQDFLEVLMQFAPDRMADTLFAVDPKNEVAFHINFPPFSLSSGTVTPANGLTYDMSTDAEKDRLADDMAVYWTDEMAEAIHQTVPGSLVDINLFTGGGMERNLGDWSIRGTTNVFDWRDRHPFRPEALAVSDADMIDIHLYTADVQELQDHLATVEFAAASNACAAAGKPMIVGEFGAHTNDLSFAEALAWKRDETDEFAALGFQGWLYWTYENELQPDLWHALDGSGEIFDALADGMASNCPPSLFVPATLATHPDGELRMQWNAIPGLRYQLLHSESLLNPVWNPVGLPMVGNGAVESDPLPATETKGFFKLREDN